MANEKNLKPPWPKGVSGNPIGKPPGIPNAKTRYRRLLELTSKRTNPITGAEEEFTQLELMDMAVFKKALKGEIWAYKEIMDRLEGKAQQKVDMTLDGEINVALVEFVNSGKPSKDKDSSKTS